MSWDWRRLSYRSFGCIGKLHSFWKSCRVQINKKRNRKKGNKGKKRKRELNEATQVPRSLLIITPWRISKHDSWVPRNLRVASWTFYKYYCFPGKKFESTLERKKEMKWHAEANRFPSPQPLSNYTSTRFASFFICFNSDQHTSPSFPRGFTFQARQDLERSEKVVSVPSRSLCSLLN